MELIKTLFFRLKVNYGQFIRLSKIEIDVSCGQGIQELTKSSRPGLSESQDILIPYKEMDLVLL